MTVGERIKSRRKECGLTMKDLFFTVGIQTGNLSELEHDKYLPSVHTLIALSRALSCSIDWILTGQEHIPDSLDSKSLKTELWVLNDGIPLNEEESDFISMYRLLPPTHREELYELTYLKYRRLVEQKKGSIHSAYDEEQSGPTDGFNAQGGTA